CYLPCSMQSKEETIACRICIGYVYAFPSIVNFSFSNGINKVRIENELQRANHEIMKGRRSIRPRCYLGQSVRQRLTKTSLIKSFIKTSICRFLFLAFQFFILA